MSKIYVCSENCGSIEETDGDKVPECCGKKMREVKKDELFGCPGCAGCHAGGCGSKSGIIDESEGGEGEEDETEE